MKILITGANGFLGYYLTEQLLAKKIYRHCNRQRRMPSSVRPVDNFIYSEMDFTDPFNVHDVFEKYTPEVVVHAGAMSKVDECEQNQWQAYMTNIEATVTLLVNAEEHKSFFRFCFYRFHF